ncbi:MAG: phosphatidylserine decarboxylase family protein [Planctomycetota bacterium]|nr:phosphatidylserine decarboxylase family protein [Planctomycetota bacterium]
MNAQGRNKAGFIAPEGWPVIGGLALVAAVVSAAAWWIAAPAGIGAAVVSVVVLTWAVWFFRDPERRTPAGEGLIVSGADGVVSFAAPGGPPAELGLAPAETDGMWRVSIFMNIFNVHVNRAPVDAVVEKRSYRPGKFFNASLDKASEHNERLGLVLRTPSGRRLAVVQIAGLIARRIVCRVAEGAALSAGQRFGLIRFGSRVDHYVPGEYEVLVRVGDRSVAGETVIARRRTTTGGTP